MISFLAEIVLFFFKPTFSVRNFFPINLVFVYKRSFDFNRNLFPTEIVFQPKFVATAIYFQQKFAFDKHFFSSRNSSSTEICFQTEIFFRQKFQFAVSRELPLTTTDRVTEDDIYVTFNKKHLDFRLQKVV